jgi:uncharacterized protein YdaU (DUF1376 family)
MHYYSHHIGDFQRDTASLSDADTLAYLRLLWMYYDTEQPLPNDPKKLAFRIGSNPDAVQMLLDTFFALEDNVWRQKRCDAEIAKYRLKSERARNANQIRWGSEKDLKSDANQIPTNNQEPITKEKANTSADADFEQFWQVWPSSQRKVAKAKCLQVWKRKQLGKHVDQIVSNVKALKASKQWKEGFDPAPLTYLNQDRWADEVVAESKTSALPAWAAEHYEARRKNEG